MANNKVYGSLGYLSIGGSGSTLAENIDIRETGKPRLAEYRIVGKRHTMYGDLGAESRQWTLSFNLTRGQNYSLIGKIREGVYGEKLKVVLGGYANSFGIKGIIKSYTIGIEDGAGFAAGGIPNRFKVTMNISEVP